MLEDEKEKYILNKDISSKLINIIRESGENLKSGIPQNARLFNLMLGEIGVAYQLIRFYSNYVFLLY